MGSAIIAVGMDEMAYSSTASAPAAPAVLYRGATKTRPSRRLAGHHHIVPVHSSSTSSIENTKARQTETDSR